LRAVSFTEAAGWQWACVDLKAIRKPGTTKRASRKPRVEIAAFLFGGVPGAKERKTMIREDM
jgi:hypothetical protein